MNEIISGDELAPCCCHSGHFTERELDVLCLVAAGAANDQIAHALAISSHTVARHLQKMLSRADARSRAELVARAYAAGILLPRTWPPGRSGRRCLEPPPPAPGTASRPAKPGRTTRRPRPAPPARDAPPAGAQHETHPGLAEVHQLAWHAEPAPRTRDMTEGLAGQERARGVPPQRT
ncbi:MAG TPA: helix-turn-helix transcriptional regulator [Streptosporangiaceae bacterium]|nr:helix-turn-helix transcriptional regulator [Streptosporangiaceae bacterium]